MAPSISRAKRVGCWADACACWPRHRHDGDGDESHRCRQMATASTASVPAPSTAIAKIIGARRANAIFRRLRSRVARAPRPPRRFRNGCSFGSPRRVGARWWVRRTSTAEGQYVRAHALHVAAQILRRLWPSRSRQFSRRRRAARAPLSRGVPPRARKYCSRDAAASSLPALPSNDRINRPSKEISLSAPTLNAFMDRPRGERAQGLGGLPASLNR